MNRPPIGIVLVNYMRWQDTIECLESALRSTIPVRIIVIDNASPNDSLAQILAWANGTLAAHPASAEMASHSTPALPKPIDYRLLNPTDLAHPEIAALPPLTIVDSGANLGFAGGNNIGLKLLLADPAIRHFWLLNNDTVIANNTAQILDDVMAATPRVGMAGTTVRFYHQPQRVQVWCGYAFSALTGQAKSIGGGAAADSPINAAEVLDSLDFVLGASLAVSRAFLETVGLMEESYFLYYEEIDWSARNRRLGADAFVTAYAEKAIVWHKEGGSIGSASGKGKRSAFSDYWLTRSRLAFTRRHYPALLPLHWLQTLALAGRRILRKEPDKARKILRALFGKPFSA